MIKIPLRNNVLTDEQHHWLCKNIGPRLHYLHNSIGGQGWIAKKEWDPGMVNQRWYLTLEDDKMATYFTIMFS